MTEDQLKQQFGSVPHLAHHTGHIIPKTIKIVSEFANLPIDCQVTLQSSILNPSDGRIKKYTVWSRVMGAHNGGDKANAGVSHIVPRKIETCSTTESSVLFIANEHVHNHPDFYRWLNVDPKEIFSAIEKRVKPGAPDTVQIRCGPDDMILPDDILQFVVIDDNAALTKLSEQYDHPIPMITQVSQSVVLICTIIAILCFNLLTLYVVRILLPLLMNRTNMVRKYMKLVERR